LLNSSFPGIFASLDVAPCFPRIPAWRPNLIFLHLADFPQISLRRCSLTHYTTSLSTDPLRFVFSFLGLQLQDQHPLSELKVYSSKIAFLSALPGYIFLASALNPICHICCLPWWFQNYLIATKNGNFAYCCLRSLPSFLAGVSELSEVVGLDLSSR